MAKILKDLTRKDIETMISSIDYTRLLALLAFNESTAVYTDGGTGYAPNPRSRTNSHGAFVIIDWEFIPKEFEAAVASYIREKIYALR